MHSTRHSTGPNARLLQVVYLSILDVVSIFGTGKTSLDFFSAYLVVIGLMFGEAVRWLWAWAMHPWASWRG